MVLIDQMYKLKSKVNWEIVSFFSIIIILTTYGMNKYIDIVYSLCLILIFVVNFKNDRFLYFYLMFYVYQEVLHLPFLNISILRIYQIIYIFRLCYNIKLKNFRCDNKKMFIVFFIFFLSTLLYQDDISVLISLAIFQLPLLYELMQVLKVKSKRREFFMTIVLFAICSGIWGFIVGGDNSLNINEGIIRRGSTFENPNLSALVYLLGLIALLGIEFKGKKQYIKIVLFLSLLLLLLSTSSVTAILLFSLIIFIYTFIYYRKMSIGFLIVGIVLLVIITNIDVSNNIILSLQNRINRILYAFQNGDLEMLTSNRSRIMETYLNYFFKLPLPNIIFGGINTTSGYFSQWFINTFHVMNSHNFIIDILYANGVIGCLIFIGSFAYTLIYHIKNFIKEKELDDFAIIALKFSVIVFALSTYVYPSIVFYLFFLI